MFAQGVEVMLQVFAIALSAHSSSLIQITKSARALLMMVGVRMCMCVVDISAVFACLGDNKLMTAITNEI